MQTDEVRITSPIVYQNIEKDLNAAISAVEDYAKGCLEYWSWNEPIDGKWNKLWHSIVKFFHTVFRSQDHDISINVVYLLKHLEEIRDKGASNYDLSLCQNYLKNIKRPATSSYSYNCNKGLKTMYAKSSKNIENIIRYLKEKNTRSGPSLSGHADSKKIINENNKVNLTPKQSTACFISSSR